MYIKAFKKAHKTISPKLKLQFNLEKKQKQITPTCHAHTAYHHSSNFASVYELSNSLKTAKAIQSCKKYQFIFKSLLKLKLLCDFSVCKDSRNFSVPNTCWFPCFVALPQLPSPLMQPNLRALQIQ